MQREHQLFVPYALYRTRRSLLQHWAIGMPLHIFEDTKRVRSRVGRLRFLQVAHFLESRQSASCHLGSYLHINSQLLRAFLRLTGRRFDIVVMQHVVNRGDTMVVGVVMVMVVMVMVVVVAVVMRRRMSIGMGVGMGVGVGVRVRVGVGMRGLLIGD